MPRMGQLHILQPTKVRVTAGMARIGGMTVSEDSIKYSRRADNVTALGRATKKPLKLSIPPFMSKWRTLNIESLDPSTVYVTIFLCLYWLVFGTLHGINSVKMADIYDNSFLAISATLARNAHDGFFYSVAHDAAGPYKINPALVNKLGSTMTADSLPAKWQRSAKGRTICELLLYPIETSGARTRTSQHSLGSSGILPCPSCFAIWA